jgi:hypothetical protein
LSQLGYQKSVRVCEFVEGSREVCDSLCGNSRLRQHGDLGNPPPGGLHDSRRLLLSRLDDGLCPELGLPGGLIGEALDSDQDLADLSF